MLDVQPEVERRGARGVDRAGVKIEKEVTLAVKAGDIAGRGVIGDGLGGGGGDQQRGGRGGGAGERRLGGDGTGRAAVGGEAQGGRHREGS